MNKRFASRSKLDKINKVIGKSNAFDAILSEDGDAELPSAAISLMGGRTVVVSAVSISTRKMKMKKREKFK